VHRYGRRSTLNRLEEVLTAQPSTRPSKPSLDEVEGQYVEIALKSVLNPVNLRELSLDRVIDFRGSHEKELQAFHDHVFSLRTDILRLCQISDAGELQRRLRRLYRDRTLPELKDLQGKLRRFGIRSVPNLLKLRIDKDLVTGTIGGFLADDLLTKAYPDAVPYAVPVEIAVVMISYVRRRRVERKHLLQESPASLLLAIQRELTG
jgi:hypothetical protein